MTATSPDPHLWSQLHSHTRNWGHELWGGYQGTSDLNDQRMSAIGSGTTLTHVQTINRMMPLTTLSKKNAQAGKEYLRL